MRVLASRYELLALVGRGGMGEVWKGTDRELGRTVAVKVLPVELTRHDEYRQRFRREARVVAALSHHGVATLHDVGEDTSGDEPVPFLVMEYVEGRTLADALRDGPLPIARAVAIARDIADTLVHSHGLGLIHRDIKPSNIMVTAAGGIKVLDFGIAKALAETTTRLTATGMMVGTPAYLSPEQIDGDTVDGRTDVYSLGCLLYELLTGRPPFLGDSPFAVMNQHLTKAPDPPSAHRPDVPESVDALVRCTLAKTPDARHPDAGALRADLESAQRALSAPPPPASAPAVHDSPTEAAASRPAPSRPAAGSAAAPAPPASAPIVHAGPQTPVTTPPALPVPAPPPAGAVPGPAASPGTEVPVATPVAAMPTPQSDTQLPAQALGHLPPPEPRPAARMRTHTPSATAPRTSPWTVRFRVTADGVLAALGIVLAFVGMGLDTDAGFMSLAADGPGFAAESDGAGLGHGPSGTAALGVAAAITALLWSPRVSAAISWAFATAFSAAAIHAGGGFEWHPTSSNTAAFLPLVVIGAWSLAVFLRGTGPQVLPVCVFWTAANFVAWTCWWANDRQLLPTYFYLSLLVVVGGAAFGDYRARTAASRA